MVHRDGLRWHAMIPVHLQNIFTLYYINIIIFFTLYYYLDIYNFEDTHFEPHKLLKAIFTTVSY